MTAQAARWRQAPAPRRSCLRKFGGGSNPAVRLVCFPWAGAGASAFRRFAPHLPPSVELLAVQYPGREDRFSEERPIRMDQIVRCALEDLRPLFDRPLVFFGHSMGALVAYEAARTLRARYHLELHMLVASGSGSPEAEAAYDRAAVISSEVELIQDIRRLGGTPPEVLENPQLLRAFLPVLRADYQVLDSYVFEPAAPLGCAITACAGREDGSVSADSVEAWLRHASGPRAQHWFEGSHFYLCAQPAEVARRLLEWIDAAPPPPVAHPCS